MNGNKGVILVREDTIIKGQIRNCRQIDIYGYVEGELSAGIVHIHKGGRFYGIVNTENAEIHGILQGEVFVKNLINIRNSGSVSGKVKYGRLAMELGGNLSAEVFSVPPTLTGDLDVTVEKGRAVGITHEDIAAVDPDTADENLMFAVANVKNGFMVLATAPNKPVTRFTQSDLRARRVVFVHDGSDTTTAGFDVVVSDESGGTSGNAQSVKVTVKGRK
ncbi:MAG: cadherin-like domain-containing protein [Hyphomicrobiaceae bacterium]